MDYQDKRRKKRKKTADTLSETLLDRRLLPHVPDPDGVRSNLDRRGTGYYRPTGENVNEYIERERMGQRYVTSFDVVMKTGEGKRRFGMVLQCGNISATGMLLILEDGTQADRFQEGDILHLKFTVPSGSMPEGFEGKIKIFAYVARVFLRPDGSCGIGVQFQENLAAYLRHKRDRRVLLTSTMGLALISLFIVLMRAESVIYFKFNRWLYLYSLISASFLLSRYLFAMFYKPVPVNPKFTPGVTVVIPCFNEEEWIQRTIVSCMDQDYPADQLEIIVVDDCSTDRSVEKIREVIRRLEREERYHAAQRISLHVQPQNKGKRDALALGAELAKHELVAFVDSDSFLDPFAIRNLVQPFQDPKMGGVTGRTDVANTFTNSLTKMQAVRYYIAFRVMKAAESVFDCVTCLSGPISCYRRQIVLDRKDQWLNQRFLGQKATFGDDRAMTNFVLRTHRTCYQDTAICSTIVPSNQGVFLRQQMRWKRSWLRESIIAGSFIWKKEPLAALNFYVGLIVPLAAPAVVIYNLLYVPIMHHVFPRTFLIGLLMMSLMMSFSQLLLRRSSTWLFAILFCIYYEAVLLWQMPIAWFTFWKSTWGTRMTPSDVKAQKKKEEREKRRHRRKEKTHV